MLYLEERNIFRSERGQTLIEHGLLLGISSTVIGIFHNDLIIALAVTALVLIILLVWKPRILVTIAVIAVLLTILFFAYRFVKYGHI